MDKKKKHIDDLHAIQEMVGKIRTLNETIQFNEEGYDEFQDAGEEAPEVAPELAEPCVNGDCKIEKANPEEVGLKELEEGGELDKIREITLHGMIALNKTPEDPKFQALLKIFNICNKAVNDNGEQEAAAAK